MSKIGDNKVIVFIGKRNSGKSCLVLDYLTHNLDIPVGMVISPTDWIHRPVLVPTATQTVYPTQVSWPHS